MANVGRWLEILIQDIDCDDKGKATDTQGVTYRSNQQVD